MRTTSGPRTIAATLATTLLLAACADPSTGPGPAATPTAATASLADAFATVPVAFDRVQSSFGGTAAVPWMPGASGSMMSGGMMAGGMMAGASAYMGGALMAGGLGTGYCGGDVWAGTNGAAVPSPTCTFKEATGRVECEPVTVNGITTVRSTAYFDASSRPQPKFDTLTTATVNTRVEVSGTSTTSLFGTKYTVSHKSDQTVTGVAKGSTRRVVSGTSSGTETTTGTNSTGAYTATRVVGDTTTALTYALVTGTAPSFPIAGRVVRSMRVTLTYQSLTPQLSQRREVVNYDGTNTAEVTITQDGKTANCTQPLPRGPLTCS